MGDYKGEPYIKSTYYNMKNTDYILFLDLDGVLVDYNGGWWAVADLLKVQPSKTNGEFNPEDLKRVGRQTRNPAFWSGLGWEHGGEALWNAANFLFEDVHILTSTGAKQDSDYHKIVTAGKVEWIADHLQGLSPSNIHVVRDGVLKAEFANHGSILVDDRKSTIQAFVKAGGYGILHDARKYKKSIEELRDIAEPLNLGEIAKRLPIITRGFWNGK